MAVTEMTYSESARGVRITARQVAHVIRQHQCEPADWFGSEDGEPGADGLYSAYDVLDWLGY